MIDVKAIGMAADVQKEMFDKICADFNFNFQSFVVEGLKLKGFEFDNKPDLDKFIKENCRCNDNKAMKHKVYYVKNKPFLLHDYNNNQISFDENNPNTIHANFGNYRYL